MESTIPCRFCKRRFSSKSAMWGHSRIHYSTYKGPDISKILASNLKRKVMDIPGEEMYPVLQSMNALFEREWNGSYNPSVRANNPVMMDGAGSSREVKQKKSPKVLDFDLNELPPVNQD